MNVITISLGQGGCIDAPLLLGYAGENDVEAVDFDFSAWAEAYGEGSLALELMRASDTAPYPAVLTIDGTVARWTVSDVDTARSGPGVAQLVYKVDGKVKKSMVFKFFVGSSIRESGDEDPWGPILDRMEEILAEVQRQAAAADQSAEAAGGSAQNAEAWAVGERGGEPVPAEDPTHANNAKYYAEQAGETAREFAEETAPAAVRAVNEAGAAKVQQINEAGTAALEVIGTARTGALDAIGTEKTGALNAIDTAGQTAGSAVDTAKTDAVQAVNTTKTDALTAVGNAQTAAVGAVRQEGTTQQAAVQKKGEDALAALQEYADLPGEVDALKTAVDTKAARNLIAGIETSMTASKAYSAGDMLIVGNTLYKVIAPEGIASGATLTPGTNVKVTTAADELADTGNRITALDTQVNADIASLKAETTELGILQPLSLLSMADYGEGETIGATGRDVIKVGNKFTTRYRSSSTTYKYIRLFGGMSVFDAWANNDFSFDNSIAIPSVTGCEVYAVCRYKHISGGGNATRIGFIEVDAENNVTLHNGPYITGPGIFMVKLDPAKHFNADLYSRNAGKVDEVEISLIAFPTIPTT